MCDILVVAIYVRYSPDVVRVEAHPLDLHFCSVTHVVTCTHRPRGGYFRNPTIIRCICSEIHGSSTVWIADCMWTWTTEMNVLVFIIGAASQTPRVIGQGEQVLESGRMSHGQVQTLHPLLALLERCKVASVEGRNDWGVKIRNEKNLNQKLLQSFKT